MLLIKDNNKENSKKIDSKAINNYLKNVHLPLILSEEEKLNCDKELTMDELEKAVNILKDNKSLGLDDLPGKFYKMFWVYIKDYILDAFKESYNDGQLPYTMRTAVLAILFKKGDKFCINNYRPISLCNTDYKNISSVPSQ